MSDEQQNSIPASGQNPPIFAAVGEGGVYYSHFNIEAVRNWRAGTLTPTILVRLEITAIFQE